MAAATPRPIAITGEAAADALLDRDPFALLTGMLLDQQFPMERAFAGPQKIAERLGVDRLDPAAIAGLDPEAFAALCATPPAVHRYPGSMAGRIQALAAVDRRATTTATPPACGPDADTGAELLRRLRALPGFGDPRRGSSSRCWASSGASSRPAGRRPQGPTPRPARTARWPTSSTRPAWPRSGRTSSSRNRLLRHADCA